jgi:hypothetical protein
MAELLAVAIIPVMAIAYVVHMPLWIWVHAVGAVPFCLLLAGEWHWLCGVFFVVPLLYWLHKWELAKP